MTTKPMLSRRLRAFLGKPRLARLCTIARNGYPHIVPIYFLRRGDDLLFGTDRGEAKVRNVLANPRAAVVIGGDPGRDDEGYLIQGRVTVHPDPNQATARRLLLRYETRRQAERQLAEWAEGDTVVLRLRPVRVIRVW